MLESNKLCRLFLFDIVPEGKEKNGGSAGESHDRIGLNRRRVLVNCGRDRSRGFRHTRLSRDSEGEEFPAVREIAKRIRKTRTKLLQPYNKFPQDIQHVDTSTNRLPEHEIKDSQAP